MSEPNPLHLVLHEPLLRPVIELGRAWIHVRHILSVLQCAAVGKVSGDAGRAEGVITDRRVNAGSMVARPALAVKSLDCTNDPHQGR